MPLYEYECPRCGRFEKIQKFSDKPFKVCPSCGEKGVERLISAPGIHFKGSGWYVTDYARKGEGKPADAKGDKAASGETKGDGKAAAPAGASESSESSSTPNKESPKKGAASSRRSP